MNSYQLPEGYKQTEVGVIPEDWNVKPMKGMISIAHGFAFEGRHFTNSESTYRLTTPGHFYEAGGFRAIGEKQKFYVGEIPINYIFQPGDLIVAMTEQADGLLGSTAIIPDEGYLHNQRIGRIRALSPVIDLIYLFFVFNSPSYREKVHETAAGTKVKHTSPEKLMEISILLPPPHEQRLIATALSDMDELLGGLDHLIAKKRDLKQATMQQLLTGKTRLPGFDGEWEVKRLKELAHIQRGASPRPIDSPIWFNNSSSIGWVRISDVTRSGMYLYETYQRLSPLGVQHSRPVARGSLIMSICATVGRPIITKIDVCIHDGFVVFNSLHVDQLFMYYVLKWIEPDWSKHGQTGSQMNLNTELINGTTARVPPLPEQTAIATILSDVDAAIAALEQRRNKTRDLKQAMMQELLTGRIRLKIE
jgi:type I restriction enzyme, S subunit